MGALLRPFRWRRPVNGRQIQDVEPEIGDARQQRRGLGEGAAAAPIGTGGSWKHLVPRAEPGALPIHPDAHRLRHRRPRSVGVQVHDRREIAIQTDLHARVRRGGIAQHFRAREQAVGVHARLFERQLLGA